MLIGFLPDHDSRQVSSVRGQTEQTEDGPEVHQQAAGPALWGLDGDGSSKEDGVAHVERRGKREDSVAVAPARGHPKGAVPLVQGEEDGGDVEGHENAQPHGPVEGPHERADGCSRVAGTNLKDTQGWKHDKYNTECERPGGNHLQTRLWDVVCYIYTNCNLCVK